MGITKKNCYSLPSQGASWIELSLFLDFILVLLTGEKSLRQTHSMLEGL